MEIVVRATVVYGVLILLMRGLRKRTLAEMSPFEMIVLVAFGDMVQQGITQEDYSLTGALLATGTFAVWITVTAWASWRSDRVRRVLGGVPVAIVEDGEVIDEALALERLPLAEVLEAARQHGIHDLRDVRLAVLEPSGKMSFLTDRGAS